MIFISFPLSWHLELRLAIVNKEPEYIGVTGPSYRSGIYGDVIFQTRPVLSSGGRLGTVFFFEGDRRRIKLMCGSIEQSWYRTSHHSASPVTPGGYTLRDLHF